MVNSCLMLSNGHFTSLPAYSSEGPGVSQPGEGSEEGQEGLRIEEARNLALDEFVG